MLISEEIGENVNFFGKFFIIMLFMVFFGFLIFFFVGWFLRVVR